MKWDEPAELVARRVLSPDAQLLSFSSERLAQSFEPGQFTMLRLPSEAVLLRRPYSLCDRGRTDSEFTLLVKRAGAGTRALMSLPLGERVSCLGPLGTRFSVPEADRDPVIVAGGVGIAPFVGFCRRLAMAGRRARVILGGRSERDLYLREEFEAFGMTVSCTTDDGSFGARGRVTEALVGVLAEPGAKRLYSCGPSAMLLRVAELAERSGIPHEVSVERRMGCGMGCCWGCVVYVERDNQTTEYVRSCTEGPVLNASSVRWSHDPYPL